MFLIYGTDSDLKWTLTLFKRWNKKELFYNMIRTIIEMYTIIIFFLNI